MKKRSSGILLHLTSLPSAFGIGDMGPLAYEFADFLHRTGQSYWQLLPINPTEEIFGNSPYSSPSAFAMNIFLISPVLMMKEGMLTQDEIDSTGIFPKRCVDYAGAVKCKSRFFDLAFKRFTGKAKGRGKYDKFCKENSFWLEDFALFTVIKQHISCEEWCKWPEKIRDRNIESLNELKKKYNVEMEKARFLQYIFFVQWSRLKSYCGNKGIQLIGDIPIYVNFDSVDVWMHPDIFKLGKNKRPVYVAGVPPDYFSETGQRWGNPVYKWEYLKKNKYSWWIERMRHNLAMFDAVRIDHFRGLVAYWEIPFEEETAVKGKWVNVPCDDFFTTVCRCFPGGHIIAEDLGIITPDVEAVMKKFKFPGMKVLVFAFNGDMNTHPYLPHNYDKNYVVYTGTHDNNTVRGWFENEATEEEKNNFINYTAKQREGVPFEIKNAHWEFIRLAMLSRAKLAIIPLQDVLGLGQEARMNIPSTRENNWQWRFAPEDLTPYAEQQLAEITGLAGRQSFSAGHQRK